MARWRTGGLQLSGWPAGCSAFEADGHAPRWNTSSTIAGALPALFVTGDVFDLHSDWQASARGRCRLCDGSHVVLRYRWRRIHRSAGH